MKSDTLSYLFDVSIDNYDLYGELEDLTALKEMLEAKARLAEEAIINHGAFPNHDEDGNLIVDFGNGKQVVIEK